MPGKRHKTFTPKGNRMAKHLKGRVRSPYAVVRARNHKRGLVKKGR